MTGPPYYAAAAQADQASLNRAKRDAMSTMASSSPIRSASQARAASAISR